MDSLILLYIVFCVSAVGAYKIKRQFIVAPAVAVTLFLIARCLISGMDVGMIAFGLIISWGLFFFMRFERDVHIKRSVKIESDLGEGLDTYHKLRRENSTLNMKKKKLDERSSSISRVYEFIKTLSGKLKIDDVVLVFFKYLDENIIFSRCHVIVFDHTYGKSRMKNNFFFEKGKKDIGSLEDGLAQAWTREALLVIKKSPKRPNALSQRDLFSDMQVRIKGRQFFLLPLGVEHRIMALLLIEGLEVKDCEDLYMLISPVAMALRKANLYEHVERISFTDGLTEIYRRAYFMDRVNEELKRSERLGLNFVILMLDLDHFKKCNDTYGHMVGDVVLKDIARVIKENIREIDLVARYGGEEFTVLLPDTDSGAGSYVAERIRMAIEKRIIVAYDETLAITVSIGISVYPNDSKSVDELVNQADTALYRSKQKGRNMVTAFERIG